MDEALRMAEEELFLLERDNLESLESSARQRTELIQRAWREQEGCDKPAFTGKLIAMNNLQNRLRERADALLHETRESLREDKRNQQGILGYCRVGLGGRGNEARMFRKFS
jgi:hypothetical protein